ncbi:MAG: hypothetical protein IJY74_01615 [Oscillospiraceae bacterium]|nr:hypothetical protein [Oscillospiraceae bacterium]
MTTLKKIFAAATAVASVGVLTMASIPASAADIAYNGPGANALIANDDGATARVNIYNTWAKGKECTDIDPAVAVIDYIEVDFTVSGLNGRTCNVNEDGSNADAYKMDLVGTIGNNVFWNGTTDTCAPGSVAITGDGSYTVRTDLTEDADTILCLILSSNINFYQLGENVTGIADSGINITVDAIRTGDAASEGGDSNNESGETTTTTTTGENGSGDTTTTTTKKNSSSSGSSSNKTNSSSSNKTSNSTTSSVTKTADAGVVAIVVGAAAAASLAVGTMTYKRKNK